jgi:glycosyltransferase involved in cell wall biosynthesis
MKIAICHNHLGERGGAERLVLYLAKHYNADIFTSFVEPEKTYGELLSGLRFHIPDFPIPRAPILKQEIASLWFSNLDLKNEYDLILTSSSLGVYACIKNRPNIWYCDTPQRMFYDLYEYYATKHWGAFKKFIVSLWRSWRVPKEQKVVRNHVEKIVTYSENVARRIKKYYNRDSEIIYPPVDTAKFECKDYEDFFLVVQRLELAKRTSKIIEAFKRMPNKKLLIVGEGPEKKELERLAKNCKNIQFLGSINEKELLDLYARCLATIYIPIDEDFGLIPVESMAAGKPCIAANEGGLKETVVHGKTGFLIKPTIKNLISTVSGLTPEKAERMKQECIKRAKKFDISVFYEKFDETIKRVIENR